MKCFSAQDWIRTSTSLRTLRPEHSASTNFATWAVNHCLDQQYLYYVTLANLFRTANIEKLKRVQSSKHKLFNRFSVADQQHPYDHQKGPSYLRHKYTLTQYEVRL